MNNQQVIDALRAHFDKNNGKHKTRARKAGATVVNLDFDDLLTIQQQFTDDTGALCCPMCQTPLADVIQGARGGLHFNHYRNLAATPIHDCLHSFIGCASCNHTQWGKYRDDWRQFLIDAGRDPVVFQKKLMRGALQASIDKAKAALALPIGFMRA